MTIDNLKMNIKIPYFAKYKTIIKTNNNISCKAKSRTCNCHQLRQYMYLKYSAKSNMNTCIKVCCLELIPGNYWLI